MKKTIFIIGIIIVICFVTISTITKADIGNTIDRDLFTPLKNSGKTIPLKEFASNGESSGNKGIDIINNAISKVTTYWKQLIGILAVLMIVIAGFRMAMATEEDTINTQKQIILWCIIGLIITLLIDTAVRNVFYGQGGDNGFVFDSESSIKKATTIGKQEIEGFLNWFLPIIATISVAMIIHSGIRLILAFGNEDVINKEKNMFFWVGFGLVMIAISKTLVNAIYNPGETGYTPRTGDSSIIINEIVGIISWLLIIIAIVAVLALIYGGYLLIVNWGYEEGVETAKKIIFSSIIGLIIIFSSYSVIATIISANTKNTQTIAYLYNNIYHGNSYYI